MTIEEILRENARRLEEIGREFDPMSGCGSTGKREAALFAGDDASRRLLGVESTECRQRGCISEREAWAH